MTTEDLLKQAVSLDRDKSNLPDPAQIVAALLKLEKDAKKKQINPDYTDLIGCWNLRFITGTKKTRKRSGVILGAGKYIPQFISIRITYESNEPSGVGDRQSNNTGRVKNSVKLASIELSLTGPTKLLDRKSIMAFDFTSIKIVAFGLKLYDGYIRNGEAREANFYHQTIKEQAFFNYFYFSKNLIAARGKGGGLALWGRDY